MLVVTALSPLPQHFEGGTSLQLAYALEPDRPTGAISNPVNNAATNIVFLIISGKFMILVFLFFAFLVTIALLLTGDKLSTDWGAKNKDYACQARHIVI